MPCSLSLCLEKVLGQSMQTQLASGKTRDLEFELSSPVFRSEAKVSALSKHPLHFWQSFAIAFADCSFRLSISNAICEVRIGSLRQSWQILTLDLPADWHFCPQNEHTPLPSQSVIMFFDLTGQKWGRLRGLGHSWYQTLISTSRGLRPRHLWREAFTCYY